MSEYCKACGAVGEGIRKKHKLGCNFKHVRNRNGGKNDKAKDQEPVYRREEIA